MKIRSTSDGTRNAIRRITVHRQSRPRGDAERHGERDADGGAERRAPDPENDERAEQERRSTRAGRGPSHAVPETSGDPRRKGQRFGDAEDCGERPDDGDHGAERRPSSVRTGSSNSEAVRPSRCHERDESLRDSARSCRRRNGASSRSRARSGR